MRHWCHESFLAPERSWPDNLGLACTDEGLLLGHTSLIERRGGRFVVRERNEIDRLLKRTYNGEPPVDRLMSRLATVARALNANDQCLVRIAAVHLEIPDLPSAAARDAMAAEDLLIKYARDEGSVDASWNPALHPRTGMPPNSGWFAPTGGTGNESADDESSRRESRLRYAENRDDSHRTDAPPTSVDLRNQPAAGSFWPNVRSAVLNWLQESVPEYDLESGRVVGERPRWQAIAPYVGVLAATAAMFGGEALAPTVPLILGLGGSETAGIALTERVAQIHGVLDPIAQGGCALPPF
jgi:hypothetical protein